MTTVKKFHDVRLDHAEQRAPPGHLIVFRLVSFQTDQLYERFTTKPAHRRQQAVALIQIGVRFFAMSSQQPRAFPVTDNLTPVPSAEVEVVKVHLGMPSYCGDEFEKCWRQSGKGKE